MKLYTEGHVWIEIFDDECVFGLSEYASEQLGEVTSIELPETGENFDQDDVLCSIESVKAAQDIYMPMTGEIIDVNFELDDDPGLINESPEEDGWIGRIGIKNIVEKDELMDEDEYQIYIENIE